MAATQDHVHGQKFEEGPEQLLYYRDRESVSANDVYIDGVHYPHFAHYAWMPESVSGSFQIPESVSVSVETVVPTTCRCVPPGVERPINLAVLGGCRSFLEREQIIPADRCPSPRLAPMASLVHTIPLQPPLPLPPLQAYLTGLPVPDRGQTLDWPHPGDMSESE